MRAPELGPDEPEATIYGAAWVEARRRLPGVASAEARALLTSAMDRVQSGWTAVRELQRWVERNRAHERAGDDYGCLLTYVETEVRESFRSMALALAHVVADWPAWERASTDDVDGQLSSFARYVTVLHLASGSAAVPPEFRELVGQAAPLGFGGEWYRQLSGVLQAIGDHSIVANGVHDARGAVEFLTGDLPEPERARARSSLLTTIETLYALTGPPPPEWLALLRDYFAGLEHDANEG